MSPAPDILTVNGYSPAVGLGNQSSPTSSLCDSTVSVSPEPRGPPPSTHCSPQCLHRFWPNSSTASLGEWLNEPNSSEQTGEATPPYEYSRDQIRGLHINRIMGLRQSGRRCGAGEA